MIEGGLRHHRHRFLGAHRLGDRVEVRERLAVHPLDEHVEDAAAGQADGERVGLESSYLSKARFPRLLDDFDPAGSLYAFLHEELDVRFGEAEERIETVLATPREALLIGTNPATPMILLHRLTWTPDGEPVERVRSLFRGDRFTFVTRLHS